MVNGIYRKDGSTSAQCRCDIFGKVRTRVSLGRTRKRSQYSLRVQAARVKTSGEQKVGYLKQ